MERLQDLFYSLPQRRLIFLPLSSLTNNILTQTSGLMPHPWHIYTCLQVGGTKGWSGSIDVGTWTTKAVNIWLWSSDVLGNARTSISLSKRSWLYACILHACFLPRSPTLSMPSILLVALIFSLLAGPSNLILPQLVKKKKILGRLEVALSEHAPDLDVRLSPWSLQFKSGPWQKSRLDPYSDKLGLPAGRPGIISNKIPKFWKSCQDKTADFRRLKFWNQNLWGLSRVLSGFPSIKNPSVKEVGVRNNHLVIVCLLRQDEWQ